MAKIKAKRTTDEVKSKKNKVKKIKEQRIISETEEEVRRFIIITIIIILFVIGMYFLSKKIVDDRNGNTTNNASNTTDTEVSIDYSSITVGTLLNRPYNEYYVLAYDSKDTEAIYYASLFSNYESKKDATKIYFLDLNNVLNSSYKSNSEVGNAKATTIDDLSFGKVTLIKVKKGKISTYIEDINKIAETLK